MLLPRRIKLLLAATLAASSLTIVIAAYSSSGAKVDSPALATGPTLKSKILRRQNRLKEKPNAYEKALLREHAAAQEERELEDRIPKHLPIKVKIRAEKDKAFKDLHNPNWLADLEIEVKNTGAKPIYYVSMLLHLPERRVGDSHEVFPLRYGRPELSVFRAKVEADDVAIKPNETYVFRIPPKLAAAYQRRLDTENFPKIRKLWLSFQLINFGDGTGFQGTTAEPWPRKKAALSSCGPALNLSLASWSRPTEPKVGMNKWRIGGELADSLPARFSYSSNLLFLSSTESTVEPDGCCPSGCQWLEGYDDTNTCYGLYCESVKRHRQLQCSDSNGSCNKLKIFYKPCHVEEGDYWHNCPESDLTPCGPSGSTPPPNPSPTPTPEPSPTPTPTPTPCPEGSFNPDQNGNCPTYASNINGCCVCQERNTDCARFGQGFLGGAPYCQWIEELCDCYNIDGKCSENPRPSPTPTPGGGGGGEPPPQPCTHYWWVWYISYDGGETWTPTGDMFYAGCF